MIYKLILNDKNYISTVEKIAIFEKDRLYCKHDVAHFQKVGKIMYNLAKFVDLTDSQDLQDLCFTIGLLHDMGRYEEYTNGISHDKALSFSREILLHYNCSLDYIENICKVISNHRGRIAIADMENVLNSIDVKRDDFWEIMIILLQIADQLSRSCDTCVVVDKCKWREEEKCKLENMNLTIRKLI